MSELNVANRTLAIMDNLPFLRSLNNECIDLIAIDPPFAANETFTSRPRPPISPEELAEEIALAQAHGVDHREGIGGTRVKDVWNWDEDIHPAWKAQIEDDYPRVFSVIQAVEACASENEAAYLSFMAVRLIECHRVLKDTGSIYVHCDSHANSYLRMLLDAVFGAENYRNQITWERTRGRSDGRHWGNVTDTIMFYVKSDNYLWQNIYVERHTDTETDFTLGDLTAAETRNGLSGEPWRGYNPTDNGRHWAVPRNNPLAEWIDANRIPGYLQIKNPHERLDTLDEAGMVSWSNNGRPSIIRPTEVSYGAKINNLWDDITRVSGKERTGYATQKPLALYQRIIQASSNPGDVVLDIFAGCATTAVAAERLGRQWIACDMAYRSWTMLKRRFYLNGFALTDMTDSTRAVLGEHQTELQEAESHTIGPDQLPIRTDQDPAPFYYLQQGRGRGRRSTQTASWSGRISKEDAKSLLIKQFGPVCWGCGYEPRRPNGTLDDTLLEVDHIRARRAAEGTQGDDELYNSALLHRTCNGIKRNKLTLEQLREHNAFNGLLYVNSTGDLVDLFEATKYANEQITAHIMEHGVQYRLDADG